ncbi:hypothetical protein [uncultured Gulosibacter sp.]|uniref:hypothetical protein n=1 Tax=uncultured Gulosibacter sp. TaxID=1339167 RepID=UPI00288A6381|nr:hypothetical protein [uncultured Gulosibacter sp.]
MSEPNSDQPTEEFLLGEAPSLGDEQWDGMLEDTFIAPPGLADHLVDLFDDTSEHDPADYTDDTIDPDVIDSDSIFGNEFDVDLATETDADGADEQPGNEHPTRVPDSNAIDSDTDSVLDQIFGTADYGHDATGIDTGGFESDHSLNFDDADYDSNDLGEPHDTDSDFDAPDDGSDAFLV